MNTNVTGAKNNGRGRPINGTLVIVGEWNNSEVKGSKAINIELSTRPNVLVDWATKA